MSLNISEKNLKKWQQTLGDTATVAVCDRGILLTADLTAAPLPEVIQRHTAYGAGLADTSFNNKFQSYKEPFVAYLRGAVGALLGALAGVILWTLTGFIGFRLWILGALISVAAFYGYMWLRGAHNTRFAVTVIVVFSLLAVLMGEIGSSVVIELMYSEEPITLLEALAVYFTPEGLMYVARSSIWSLVACALGFVGIRGKVMDYTHERTWLRRKK